MTEKRPDRTLGGPHDTFWDWTAKGELRLQRCACGELTWPPVDECDHCHGTSFTWERVSGRGRIAAWCSFERDYYYGMLPMPWDTILVELEEGPLFLSNPHDIAREQIAVGLPVELVFIDAEDSAGAFRLPVFGKG